MKLLRSRSPFKQLEWQQELKAGEPDVDEAVGLRASMVQQNIVSLCSRTRLLLQIADGENTTTATHTEARR